MRLVVSTLDKAAAHLMLNVFQSRIEAKGLLGHVLIHHHFVVTVVALLGGALSILIFDLSHLDGGSAKCLVELVVCRE